MHRILSGIILVVFLFTSAEGAGPARKKGRKAALKKQDNVLVAELRQAFRLLDSADPIYRGHRAKARREINSAIGALQKEMHKRGLKPHHIKNGARESKSLSDTQVRETARHLGIIVNQISALPPTKHRAKAVQHLGAAIKQLELALRPGTA